MCVYVRLCMCLKTSSSSCRSITKCQCKSCLMCVMSEKYAFWVTLRPQSDSCRQGEAEVHIFDFKATWSEFQKASQTATEQGNAELGILNFKKTSSLQSRSHAVVCVSTPRMYPRSGYFLVFTKLVFHN